VTAARRAAGDAADGIRCSVGVSRLERLEAAIEAAIRAAMERPPQAPPGTGPATGAAAPAADLAVVFVSAAYGADVRPAFEHLSERIPARVVIGTTAEGVLAGDEEYEGGPAVAVWLAWLPGATVVPVSIEYAQTPDGGMFAGWPPADTAWPDDAALILLADPFSFPVDGFIRRLEEDHPGLVVVGGMASGGMRPGDNTLVVDSRTYDSGAVGVIVGGGVRIRPVISQGCRPIGRPLVITRAEENVIMELGGRPALERLHEIFAELDEADRRLVRTSLHVGRAASEYRDHFGRGDFLVRNVVGADPESGIIAVGDLVRTGQTMQFHVRDAASADDDLRNLLTQAAGGTACGALVFTCNGRGTRLFDAPHHDARCVQEVLGGIPTAGFFAQGEIGPIGDRTFLHGFTAAIAVVESVGPRPAAADTAD
jgi:small ligand-binding sensory domain FIST